MKTSSLVLAGFIFSAILPALAQNKPENSPEKRVSVGFVAGLSKTGDLALDAAIQDLYSVISGPAGQKRDWEKFRNMFAPGGRMGVAFTNKEGVPGFKPLSPEEYISTSGKYVEENGFFEKEIGQKTERFGTLVQVWSSYEARQKETDAKPLMRGINSIQFVKIGGQYKIASLIWHQESAQFPLPPDYLPAGK